MDQDLVIITPEKTILSYRLAGVGSRVGAHFLDLILVVVMMVASFLGILYTVSQFSPGLAQGFALAFCSALPFLYFILLEGLWNGQTLGKAALGLRVRMADGTPITFLAAMGRNFLRPADMLPGPYFIGLIAMFLNPRSQRLGDIIADTVVCYERRGLPVFAPAPHAVGQHSLEGQVGDLRGLTPAEYQALRRMCDRFPEFSASIQAQMIQDVWDPVARRLQIAPLANVHPIYLAEAVVMKYGRQHGLL